MKTTAKEVLKIRNSLGMTQEAFSRLTGLSRVNIAKYETGRSIPPGDVMLALVRGEFPIRLKTSSTDEMQNQGNCAGAEQPGGKLNATG